jgi:phospholipid-translocating ATPase
VPFLKVGLLVTYVAPLVFVLIVTMIKEGYDDIKRYSRDQVLNKTKYDKVDPK